MILVTGGSGHLGANLIRHLLSQGGGPAGGQTIRTLVREGSDNRALDGLAVERVIGDLRDPASLARAVQGCARVYHCAAKISTVAGGEQDLFDNNVVGTNNMLAAAHAAGVKRVVVSGSLSAVGYVAGRPSDETFLFNPFEHALPYEKTKALVELACWKAAAGGMEVIVATSCAIVGPNDYKPSRMGKALLDFALGKMSAYIPGGFEFVAARDIASGHALAMEKGRSGQKYIFGSGYVSIDELVKTWETVTGRRRPRLRLPPALMMGIASVTSPILTALAPSRPQRLTPDAVRLLQMGRRADCTKAKTELGYEPSSVHAATRDAFDDFVRRGVLSGVSSAVAPDATNGATKGAARGARA